MNFDRNTIIGVVLLVALLFVYLYISTSNSHELARYQKQQAASLARVKAYKDSLADLQGAVGRLGPMLIQTSETVYTNQKGEVVAKTRGTGISY